MKWNCSNVEIITLHATKNSDSYLEVIWDSLNIGTVDGFGWMVGWNGSEAPGEIQPNWIEISGWQCCSGIWDLFIKQFLKLWLQTFNNEKFKSNLQPVNIQYLFSSMQIIS